MFDERLPVHIDPIRYADTARELRGRMSLSEMGRLSALLLQNDGEVEMELSFGVDAEGIRYMRGHLTAEVVMQCQRCLGPMPIKVESDLMLAMVRESDSRELPSYYEPLSVGSEPIFLQDIIEDELILSLPIVPKHSNGECAVVVNGKQDKTDSGSAAEGNPFAVLAGLKRN